VNIDAKSCERAPTRGSQREVQIGRRASSAQRMLRKDALVKPNSEIKKESGGRVLENRSNWSNIASLTMSVRVKHF